jgi:hypothetical protein
MRAFRLLLGVLLLSAWAQPAVAKLGDPIESTLKSPLLQGDRLFHFEGRYGSQYRFSGADACEFGQGLYVLDTDNGTVVRESLVMPLPASSRDEKILLKVAGMFLKEAGLDQDLGKQGQEALWHTYQTSKSFDGAVGPYWLRSVCDPSLDQLLLSVRLNK